MTHLDLFSGIGGFAYAIDQVWEGVEHIFCDNEPFAREVIKKHWPESEIYDDIRSITADTLYWGQKEQEQQTAGSEQCSRRPLILTGGFPCQPFSQAGVRRGTSDERYLWPEMLRVIRLTKPQWVIAENVRGLLTLQEGMVFEQVCLDLEESGYAVQPFIIPAVAVNAPHRRDRIWFVANRTSERSDNRLSDREEGSVLHDKDRDATKGESERSGWKCGAGETSTDDTDTPIKGRERGSYKNEGRPGQSSRDGFDQRRRWDTDWMEVAARFCSVDDGLPAEVGGFTLTKAGHRKEQLKAYGNAIVPQVAIEILRGIKENNNDYNQRNKLLHTS